MSDVRENLTNHIAELAQLQGIESVVGGYKKVRFPQQDSKSVAWADESLRLIHAPDAAPTTLLMARQFEKIEIDSGPIGFSDGVAVGGYSHLSLFPNGAFSFTGHYHVSGAISYDTLFTLAIKSQSSNPTVLTFTHKGRCHGTFESGSRDDDWGDSGTNQAVAAVWNEFSQFGYTWQWNAAVNADIGQLLRTTVEALGAANTVISVVGAIL
ncbi:hypothetical protein [Microcystis aeruginosa]|jgi:hypothetical protein|uniref:hypothetical protein n=1 Tax=Microcystis aeruginosa TaxID=1126 RepID=UPI00232E20BA|nr:hypothetical protein [Microcystis aeruginosa]MDB9390832.1 hypothetical protein [Microcystis aeruginosa CS-579]